MQGAIAPRQSMRDNLGVFWDFQTQFYLNIVQLICIQKHSQGCAVRTLLATLASINPRNTLQQFKSQGWLRPEGSKPIAAAFPGAVQMQS